MDFVLLIPAMGILIKLAAKRQFWPIDWARGAEIAVAQRQELMRVMGVSGRRVPLSHPHCAMQPSREAMP